MLPVHGKECVLPALYYALYPQRMLKCDVRTLALIRPKGALYETEFKHKII